jgi:hypothetical protein
MRARFFATMKLPLVLVMFSAAAVLARADILVVQRVEGAGQSGEQTIRVKDGRARCDIGGAVSVIVDRQTGETTTLSHAERGYLTLTPEASRAMLEKMRKARGSQEAPPLVDTGKKEKIGEYACEVFTADVGAVKVTYWLARDYPDFQTYLTQLDVLEGAPGASPAGGIAPRTKDLPGMPMKMVMEMSGQKITISLISAKEENADPAIFKVPAGYKELPAPPTPAKS